MITFHKLTQAQFEKVVERNNLVKDGLYFLTDVRELKLCNGEQSVTTFGTNVKTVLDFPPSASALPFYIYLKLDTKEQRIWTGEEWEILSYPVINLITSGLAADDADTTVPNTKAVYNFVQDRVAAAELGVQVKLHTPVDNIQDLQDLPLSGIEDKCMCLVLTVGLFRYDAQSSDVDNGNNVVVVPSELLEGATGRWIKMFNNVGYTNGNGVNIDYVLLDLNQVISLNVNSDQFTFVDGALTLNPSSQVLDTKVDKISGHGDLIATWKDDGNQNTSGYKLGKDSDNLTYEDVLDVPPKKVATERAVKWYIDRSLSFNPETIDQTLSAIIDYDD